MMPVSEDIIAYSTIAVVPGLCVDLFFILNFYSDECTEYKAQSRIVSVTWYHPSRRWTWRRSTAVRESIKAPIDRIEE